MANMKWWIAGIVALATACGDDVGSSPADASGSSAGSSSGSSTGSETSATSVPASSSSETRGEPDTSGADASSDTSSAGSTTGSNEHGGSSSDTGPMPSAGAVDVLFVVGNGPSMGLEQAKLTEAIAGFVAALDDAAIDWRIGVTTTDDGNPLCGISSPEAGQLQASSCRGRLNEFVLGDDDVSQESCLDLCGHETITIDPTATELDATLLPRPWIENIAGVDNVGDGVSPAEALACLLPQGIAGCAFGQPLDAMRKTLLRAENLSESAYGFLREGVPTAIVLVTDAADCSYDDDWDAIFLSEQDGGNQVFWSDPDAPAATPAVCWNAGTACTGGPGTYDECHAVDLDVDGGAADDDGDAVLRSLSHFADDLADRGEVYLAAIDGVPIGYDDGSEDMAFADDADPEAQLDRGIGPGCTNGDESAVPSVRIRELVETIDGGERNDFSACDDSYATALATIAQRIIVRATG
jgi:hypothetical protein